MQRAMRRKQMGPIVINGSIHTARKHYQRKNIPICLCVAWCVLCELGHTGGVTRKMLNFSIFASVVASFSLLW